jgi:hypothetical protein
MRTEIIFMSNSEINSKANKKGSISILELSAKEAREHLLKPESYCSLDLPPYFVFEKMLKEVNEILDGKNLSDFLKGNPREYENVNYKILNNKNGTYAWRPFQLIHPAIYVSLVQDYREKQLENN